jgi:hypothetical protein
LRLRSGAYRGSGFRCQAGGGPRRGLG